MVEYFEQSGTMVWSWNLSSSLELLQHITSNIVSSRFIIYLLIFVISAQTERSSKKSQEVFPQFVISLRCLMTSTTRVISSLKWSLIHDLIYFSIAAVKSDILQALQGMLYTNCIMYAINRILVCKVNIFNLRDWDFDGLDEFISDGCDPR